MAVIQIIGSNQIDQQRKICQSQYFVQEVAAVFLEHWVYEEVLQHSGAIVHMFRFVGPFVEGEMGIQVVGVDLFSNNWKNMNLRYFEEVDSVKSTHSLYKINIQIDQSMDWRKFLPVY